MKKKIVCIGAVVIMSFSLFLTACGNKAPAEESQTEELAIIDDEATQDDDALFAEDSDTYIGMFWGIFEESIAEIETEVKDAVENDTDVDFVKEQAVEAFAELRETIEEEVEEERDEFLEKLEEEETRIMGMFK